MKKSKWMMLLLAAALVVVSVRWSLATSENPVERTADSAQTVIDCIMTRTSIRSFTDRAVPDSLVTTILKAGMAAPTAVNKQPWALVVVDDRQLLDTIAGTFPSAKMAKDCAFAVVVCGDMNLLFDGDNPEAGFWVQDCSAVTENMLLAAHALGLGAVWCGIYPDAERMSHMRHILNLPTNLKPLNVVPMGYPAVDASPKEKWDTAKVHRNSF